MIDISEFRRILGHWASSVGVVTTVRDDGRPCGLTATSFASLSLEPFMVLVCVKKTSDTYAFIRSRQAFAVNFLDANAEAIARRFATSREFEKFEGVAYQKKTTGSPILDAALGWVDCRVKSEYEGGDHTIFVGEVVDGNAIDGSPLVYYRGSFGRFTP